MNHYDSNSYGASCLKDKILLVTKLTTLLLVSNFLQLSASSHNYDHSPIETALSTPGINFAKIDIGGKILDETGQGLPGATIKVKGTTQVAVTDHNGKFILKQVDQNAILVISYVGYISQEIKARSQVNLSLVAEAGNLEGVVVVGFGVQKKVSVTASIVTISNKELLQTPAANISNALVGRMPGLIAQQSSGDPGVDGSSLLIRGKATLNSSAPLILVDGVERPFNSISPFEVESISVLKDAGATAVYGVRGANGVILVTTKRGVEGKARINLTYTTGLQEVTRVAKFVDSYNFATLMNEALGNEGKSPIYDQTALDAYKNHTDPYLYPDVDYVKEFLKPFAPQQNININASGGTKLVKYFVSGGYLSQSGLFNHTNDRDFNGSINYNRFNFRSNVDVDVNPDFRLSVNLAARNEVRNGPRGGTGRLFSLLMRTPPNNGPLLNPDGTYGAGPSLTDNVLAEFSYQGYTKDYTNLMEGTFTGVYKLDKILKGLSVKPMLAFTNQFRQQTSRYRGSGSGDFYTRYQLKGKDADGNYIYGAPIGTDNPILNFAQTFVSDADNSYRTIQFEGSVNYANSFDKHNVTGLLLYNRSRKTLNRTQTFDWPFSYQGLVGRLTYNWDNRYLVEANMGYNGSEQFPDGHKYGLFPSVSAGWVITGEPFMKNLKAISFLKLRASYGQVGNDKVTGDPRFLYLDNPYTTGGGYSFGLNNNNNPGGINEGAFGNKFVQWEKANKTNIGLESAFFDSKLTFNADVFYERRSNILTLPGTIPATVGAALPIVNLGIVENKGYELEIGYKDKVGTFSYFVKANISYTRNKVLFRDEPEAKYPWLRTTGQSLDMQYGLQTAGFFKNQAEIDSWAKSSYDPGPLGKLQPGDFKYVDQNKDGVIDDFDKVPLRNPTTPRYIMGFNLGGSFKNFDFSMLLQGAAETAMVVNLEAGYEFFNTGKAMDIHLNRWTPETAETATYPRLSSAPSSSMHNYINSDFWVKDASYVRLKQAEIGYTFSQGFLDRIKISSLRLYLNGSNLYTWSSIKYLDPENRNQRAWYYPQQRVWSVGVNVTF
ncbi:TonB-dependent receptor [Pedobacter sp. PAMC26386]|nr:TonB-dependent receptor [Pedobacter sp. PAMC26386]